MPLRIIPRFSTEAGRGFDSIGIKRPRTQTVLLIAIVALLAIGFAPLVRAQPIDQKQTDAKKEVERLQENLEDAVEKYNFACSKLESTKGEISENEENLTVAEAELTANKARLNNRIRAMYVSRHNQFLDVMVNSGNFDQFLVGLDLAKKISQKDAELVASVKDAKAKLEASRAALQERKAAQEEARRDMSASKAEVEGQLSSAKGKLASIEDEVRQAIARRAAEASTTTSTRTYPTSDPVTRRTRPPGAPHGGVVGVAYDQLGKPYVWGAAGPDSFDCSGLTMYCYAEGAGISITHSSYGQAYCGTPVSVSELQPGDILGFRGWGHVGIYIGGDSFIHAPQSGDVVKISSLSARTNFCGAVRP